MKQFDLFQNPSATMRDAAPYLVVLSSHLLFDLAEVIVAPVIRSDHLKASSFDVPVTFDQQTLLISVIALAAIDASRLKQRVGSLLAHEDEIRRALDRLFTGF